jgi:hypothetical protein
VFSPLDFLSKLAALVPRPRHNLVRYHGVFARGCHQPNSTLRKLIIPKSTKRVRGKENSKPDKMSEFEEAVSRNELVAPLTWAQRRDGEPLKRVFIGRGRLRITNPDIIQKILDHIEAQPSPLPDLEIA